MIFLDLFTSFVTENFIILILAVGLLLVLSRKTAIGKRSARFIRAIAILVLILSVADFGELYFAALSYPTIWRKIFSWIGYSLRPLLIVLFIRSTISRKFALWFYSLIVVNAGIFATTFIPQTEWVAFTYDAENSFQRGPLGFASHVVSFIYILALIVLVSREFKTGERSTVRAIRWCAAACVIAALYETFIPTGSSVILNETILASSCFYYMFLHTQITRAETMEKELLLSDQRAAMIVQEINPRFLYDIVSRIHNFAKTDSKRSEETLSNLVDYLEYNLEMTDFVHPISFEEELERVIAYLKIEQARLPGLKVLLQIEDKDFMLPALTVQHMVENSVQHGLENQSEGTVMIKTFKSESGHSIIIQDNGRGFQSEQSLTSENQGSRFGIANVTDRLERMVSGDINIVTKPGVGTTVLISIPNDKEEMKALKDASKDKNRQQKKLKVEETEMN